MNWKVLFICFCTYYSTAQSELTFRNYSQELGLESSTIYDLLQDNEGYIYVGHDKGCSKFNGLSFSSPICTEEPNALGNFMRFSSNQILCRNFQGKSFQLKNGTLRPISIPIESSWGFPTFMEDGKDHYVFRDKAIARIDENGKGKTIELNIPSVQRIYHGVVKDQVAYLFISFLDKTELLAYDLNEKKIRASRRFPIESSVRLYKTNNEVYWLNEMTGEMGDVRHGFKTSTGLFDGILDKGTKFTDFVALKDGRKLIGTFNGLFVLDEHWQLERHFLKGIQCSKILVDRDKGLWIGSLQDGLFYAPSLDCFQVNASEVNGRNIKFSKFFSDGQSLFAGTFDGRILRFNETGEIVQTIDFQRDAEIQSIYVKGNDLYAYCAGLIQVDISTGKIVNEWKWHATKSIHVENDQIYCGTSKGLAIFTKGVPKSYSNEEWIRKVVPYDDQHLVVESTEAIYRFNKETNEKKIIRNKGQSLQALNGRIFFKSDSAVFVLLPDWKRQEIVHSKGKISRLFVLNDRLIVELEGNKWLSISPKTYALSEMEHEQLLKEMLFISEVGNYDVQANNTTIQFIQKNRPTPHRHLRLKTLGKTGNFKLRNGLLNLPYNDNDLSIRIDLLPNYHYSGKGEVFYRIVELDKDWRKAISGDEYTVELLRIPPGSYTLEIYGTNGVDTTKVLRYAISVDQPYYFQWWFILLLVLFVGLLFYLLMHWRSRLAAVKNNRKLRDQELKLNALNSELIAIRSQMNPHFIFNSLSSIQTKILNEDRVEAYKNLNTFSTLLRQALQFTSKEFISLADEISFTRNYIQLEQTRTSNAFEFIEETDPEINTDVLRIPSLFLQPFVENAIRHGLMHSKKDKCLRMKISVLSGGFRIIIEDNGIGIAASNAINREQQPEHQSFASKAIYDRIAILRETKKMDIDLAIIDLEKGTRVEINFQAYEGK